MGGNRFVDACPSILVSFDFLDAGDFMLKLLIYLKKVGDLFKVVARQFPDIPVSVKNIMSKSV